MDNNFPSASASENKTNSLPPVGPDGIVQLPTFGYEPRASLLQRMWLFFLIAAIAIIADQITKRMVENSIGLLEEVTIAPWLSPYLTLTHTQNTGAAFSILPEGGYIFFIIGIIVTSLILYYTPRLPDNDHISRVALALQMGGALGNLIDRVRQGYVTDFVHFQIPEINFDFPVFNVADSCIVIGVILLILITLFRKEPVQS